MPRSDLLAILPATILSNPYNSGLYTALYSRLGDPEGGLTEIASYFGMSSKLSGLTIETLNNLFEILKEILKPDFYKSKASSAQARKAFVERSQFYGRSPEESRKILDDFISQARNSIEEWQKWQDPANEPPAGARIVFFVVGCLLWAWCTQTNSNIIRIIAGILGLVFFAVALVGKDYEKGQELEQKAKEAQFIVYN